MERLEAALQKAREKRREAGIDDTAVLGPENRVTASRTAVTELSEIKISTRIARNHRLNAFSGNSLSGPYDLLRSRALNIMGENGWKRLAITSPTMGCGKSTVTANLVLSLSRQSEITIVLLDLDLRRPSLHKIFGHKPQSSLTEVINGEVSIPDHFLRLGANLILGLNSEPAPNPSELLQSRRTKGFLARIEAAFRPDLMIFDMPPMLGNDDNVGFLQNVDCSLLVGAADKTTVTQLDLCEKEIAELTNVLGVVLNKCRYSDSVAGYDYDHDAY